MAGRLRLGVRLVENVLLVKVLEQDEDTRRLCGEVPFKSWPLPCGVRFISDTAPQLNLRFGHPDVFLRGTYKEKDNMVVCEVFSNSMDAEGALDLLKQAVKEFNDLERPLKVVEDGWEVVE